MAMGMLLWNLYLSPAKRFGMCKFGVDCRFHAEKEKLRAGVYLTPFACLLNFKRGDQDGQESEFVW